MARTPSNEECSKCKFWLCAYEELEIKETNNSIGFNKRELRESKASGACRRYPPVAVEHEDGCGFGSFDGDATDFFDFVHTRSHDWCGEYLQRPKRNINKPQRS